MIDSYEKIFLELNQAMRDDPMLNDLVAPELFDQIMATWKKNLEKRGIVRKNSFVTSKGFYSTFRDRLDHFSALGGRSGPGGSAFRPIRIDENPFILEPQKRLTVKPMAVPTDKGYFDMQFTQSNEFMTGKDLLLAQKMDFSVSQDKGFRSSNFRDSRASESMLAVKGMGNSYSMEKPDQSEYYEGSELGKPTDNEEPLNLPSSTSQHRHKNIKLEEEKIDQPVGPRIEFAIDFANFEDEPSDQTESPYPKQKQQMKYQPPETKPSCKIEAECLDEDGDLFGDDADDEDVKFETAKLEAVLPDVIKQEPDGMMLNKRADHSDIVKDEHFQDDDDDDDDEDLFDSIPDKNDSDEQNPYAKMEPKKEKPAPRQSDRPKPQIKTAMDMKIEASLLRDLENLTEKPEDGKTSLERAREEIEVVEEELNSNDDISDYNDDFDTGDNLLLGFFVKSKRKKDKRKITFKNCVLRINGQEQVISEARGEFRWAYGARERARENN